MTCHACCKEDEGQLRQEAGGWGEVESAGSRRRPANRSTVEAETGRSGQTNKGSAAAGRGHNDDGECSSHANVEVGSVGCARSRSAVNLRSCSCCRIVMDSSLAARMKRMKNEFLGLGIGRIKVRVANRQSGKQSRVLHGASSYSLSSLLIYSPDSGCPVSPPSPSSPHRGRRQLRHRPRRSFRALYLPSSSSSPASPSPKRGAAVAQNNRAANGTASLPTTASPPTTKLSSPSHSISFAVSFTVLPTVLTIVDAQPQPTPCTRLRRSFSLQTTRILADRSAFCLHHLSPPPLYSSAAPFPLADPPSTELSGHIDFDRSSLDGFHFKSFSRQSIVTISQEHSMVMSLMHPRICLRLHQLQASYFPPTLGKMMMKINQKAENAAYKAKKDALGTAVKISELLVDTVNGGVEEVFINEKRIEHEIRGLVSNVMRYKKQTNRWLAASHAMNSVLKEIGDFENWMKTMDFDCKSISVVIQNIHQT
ncbi:Biogenesis of lysosome-related organelles complex 1 subunit 1 [Apostasia shenzhenica]|uniref:Biogenesis of lysosome-related organelles complex 1 subunit 1 n=1 Tax=Apostasia shenzhenica TaxID=1088818 RepID=A0A2I0BEP9_9ASPA|nr:Biogenesis of lysosome-related organelles complex 1 subunit 1 [Apostasia shenzhenica]